MVTISTSLSFTSSTLGFHLSNMNENKKSDVTLTQPISWTHLLWIGMKKISQFKLPIPNKIPALSLQVFSKSHSAFETTNEDFLRSKRNWRRKFLDARVEIDTTILFWSLDFEFHLYFRFAGNISWRWFLCCDFLIKECNR